MTEETVTVKKEEIQKIIDRLNWILQILKSREASEPSKKETYAENSVRV